MAATILACAAALAAISASGSIASSEASLVEMGFDPDRAALIASLLIALLVGGVGAFTTGMRLPAAIAGITTSVLLYGPTFANETRVALGASGVLGSFSASGWVLTIVALAIAGLIVAWAGPTLAIDARRGFVSAGEVAAQLIRTRTPRRQAWRPVVAIFVILGLIVGVPAFGALVNYTPDTLMLSGQDHGGIAQDGTPAPTASQPGGALPSGSQLPIGNGATSQPSKPSIRPWFASIPHGTGVVQTLTFPAPWTGGTSTTATVSVYLPPGYSSNGSLRYDTLYFVPWGLDSWVRGINVLTMLDAMTASGRIPPSIAVFVSEVGGPYPDSECIDSNDGREKVETYLTKTVVPAIDAKFRTIVAPSARTLLGFSQGGFCSSMLLLRHPDLFGNAIPMFGYYHAAPITNAASNAPLPFGGNATLIATHSPVVLASQLPAATAKGLYVVIVGSESATFYGPQMMDFEHALESAHLPFTTLTSTIGHSWVEVRDQLPHALDDVFARLAAAGVYAGIYS